MKLVKKLEKNPEKKGILLGENEYLSDRLDLILERLEKADKMKLVSPTGSGKTVAIKSIVKHYKTTVILLPYNAMISLYNEFNCVSSELGGIPLVGEVNVMIWDQAIKYEQFFELVDLVVVDEEHTAFFDKRYRDSAIEVDKLLTGKVLFVSATPVDYFKGEELRFCKADKRKVTINFVQSEYPRRELDELIEGERVCIFSDRYFQKSLSVGLNMETSIGIYCSEQNTKVISQLPTLLKSERLTKRINYFTSAAFNGLNIRNENEKIRVIIMNDDTLNIQAVLQILGRFRGLVELDVWLVGKGIQKSNLEALKMIYEAGGVENRLTRNYEILKAVKDTVEGMTGDDLLEALKDYDRYIWVSEEKEAGKSKEIEVDGELDEWFVSADKNEIISRIESRIPFLKRLGRDGRKELLFLKSVKNMNEFTDIFRKYTKCSWNTCIRKANAFKNVKEMSESDFIGLLDCYQKMMEAASNIDKSIWKTLSNTLEELKLYRQIDCLEDYFKVRKSKEMTAKKAIPVKVVNIRLGQIYRFESISEFCRVTGGKTERASAAFKNKKEYRGWRFI